LKSTLTLLDGDVAQDSAALTDARFTALLIGPGLGRSAAVADLLWAVLSPACIGDRPALLDADALTEALKVLKGTHDFHGFAAYRGNETPEMNYTRTIHAADLETLPDGYRITFSGDGFLYKMVRLLTGGAVHVAQGRMRLDDFSRLLDQPPKLPFGKSPLCAPADGLFLEEVRYGE
jgi:tRNA pseudouridine38-40 synthase